MVCRVTVSCAVLQIAKRMMDKKYRERITDGLQQLEQNGGQVCHMLCHSQLMVVGETGKECRTA